jgi:PBP1b-binding outer membrane lipoprotein LpoB
MAWLTMVLVLAFLLSACASTKQLHSTTQALSINLEPQVLKTTGIAFITPTSVTGQEEDKQALALAFTEALKLSRPDLRIVSLPETLGAINRAGLASEYRQMFEDYRQSGIFSLATLQKVSQLTGARYLAQLKLSGFRQESKNRWGTLGIRMVETKTTFLRLYLQIWDGQTGLVAWEGAQELQTAHETLREDAISFKTAVEQSAHELLARLP